MRSFERFAIGFDQRDRARLFNSWNDILDRQVWVEGRYTQEFESKWSEWNNLPAVAFNSWSGAALAVMAYYKELRGELVLCPTNTFIAVPNIIKHCGSTPVFVDSNRYDLCMESSQLDDHLHEWSKPGAVWLTHIGGHIAFNIKTIAEWCAENDIILFEDCAHAHGASWNGRKPGTWGDCGVYSFYATKTISTGEGGMLVSKHKDLIEFAREYRNYGKPSGNVRGLNLKMSEFTAAIGSVQVDRLQDIVDYKNEIAERELNPKYDHIQLPEGMISGLYKYIVFNEISNSTGKVYDTLANTLMGVDGSYPNSEWISRNHWCSPLYYRPEN